MPGYDVPSFVNDMFGLVHQTNIFESTPNKITVLKDSQNYQVEMNEIYKFYCEMVGFDPSDLKTKSAPELVPTFPTDAFKKYFPNGEISPLPKMMLTVPEYALKLTLDEQSRFYESSATSGNPSLIGLTQEDFDIVGESYGNVLRALVGEKNLDNLLFFNPELRYIPKSYAVPVQQKYTQMSREYHWVLKPGEKGMDLDINLVVGKMNESEQTHKSILFGPSVPLMYRTFKTLGQRKKWNLKEGFIMCGTGGWDGKKGSIQVDPIKKEDFVKSVSEITGIPISREWDSFGTTETKINFPGHYSEGIKDFVFHTPEAYTDVFVRRPSDNEILGVGKEGVLNIVTPLAFGHAGTGSIVVDDWVKLLSDDGCDECGRKGKTWQYIRRAIKSEKTGCAMVALEKLSEVAKNLVSGD
ncbi:MAG: hypothetical protein NTW30_05000 [Candidatus Aenigmarchaeota archaeon]|nr:hypothetical protein [Candidatus Aenigmarchaeota archaeon]